MNLNGRGFLGMFAAYALDPERLLWVPALVFAPLAAETAPQMRDHKTGIAVRFVRDFDANLSKNRFDVLGEFWALPRASVQPPDSIQKNTGVDNKSTTPV